MKLILVAAVLLMIAFLTADRRWRPLALGGAFLLRIGVPSLFGGVVFGGLHLSTLLIFAYALVWPFATQKAESNRQSRRPNIPILCHATVLTVAVGTVMMSGSGGAAMFAGTLTANQLVAPYIFCMLIYGTSLHSESFSKDAGRFFALICVFEAMIAILVSSGTLPQPFASLYNAVDYWSSLGSRQTGTLDHPLCLGLLLAAGIPMVAYFNSALIAVLSAGCMVTAIALTQSRIAALGAAIGIFFLVTIALRSNSARLAVVFAGGIGIWAASNFGVFSSLIDRVGDDSGSSLARIQSWTLFLDTWNDFGTLGVGMEGSKEYFLLRGLRASGESATVAYAVGIGIPLTLLYMAVMVWLIGYGIRNSNKLMPASAAAIICFISIQLFSSISTESAAGMILWATIGLSLASPRTASVTAGPDATRDRVRSARTLHRNIPVAARSSAPDASQHPPGSGVGGSPRSRGS